MQKSIKNNQSIFFQNFKMPQLINLLIYYPIQKNYIQCTCYMHAIYIVVKNSAFCNVVIRLWYMMQVGLQRHVYVAVCIFITGVRFSKETQYTAGSAFNLTTATTVVGMAFRKKDYGSLVLLADQPSKTTACLTLFEHRKKRVSTTR